MKYEPLRWFFAVLVVLVVCLWSLGPQQVIGASAEVSRDMAGIDFVLSSEQPLLSGENTRPREAEPSPYDQASWQSEEEAQAENDVLTGDEGEFEYERHLVGWANKPDLPVEYGCDLPDPTSDEGDGAFAPFPFLILIPLWHLRRFRRHRK